MKWSVKAGVIAGIYLAISFGVAGAQEAAVPLTLEESIDIALKQSVIIQSAREGLPCRRRGRRKPSRGFSRN